MSKASTPIKVLRTALKRVDKGWTQGDWYKPGDKVAYVCLEGALFGYCNAGKHGLTDAQQAARAVIQQIISERHPGHSDIPSFNDQKGRTKDEILEVIKLAIIWLETTGDGEMDDDDFEDLLEFSEKL